MSAEDVMDRYPDDDKDTDYVTVNPAVERLKYNVVVMEHTGHGEYRVKKASGPMSRFAADALAQSWAVALNLGIR